MFYLWELREDVEGFRPDQVLYFDAAEGLIQLPEQEEDIQVKKAQMILSGHTRSARKNHKLTFLEIARNPRVEYFALVTKAPQLKM